MPENALDPLPNHGRPTTDLENIGKEELSPSKELSTEDAVGFVKEAVEDTVNNPADVAEVEDFCCTKDIATK